MKYGGGVLNRYLCSIINAKMPSSLKNRILVPIHKCDNKPDQSLDSCRLVSLPLCIFKVFEKLIHSRIENPLTKNLEQRKFQRNGCF